MSIANFLLKVKLMNYNNNINKLINFLLQEQNFEEKLYLCKDVLFDKITTAIKSRTDLIDSQNKYEEVIDEEIQKTKEELDLTLSQIARHLYDKNFLSFKE